MFQPPPLYMVKEQIVYYDKLTIYNLLCIVPLISVYYHFSFDISIPKPYFCILCCFEYYNFKKLSF